MSEELKKSEDAIPNKNTIQKQNLNNYNYFLNKRTWYN